MVSLSGILLGASFLPWRLGYLSYIAFVPLFILVETIPRKTPEDLVFLPIKRFIIGIFRLITFQFLWRKEKKPLIYDRKLISGNAQVFRYTYATFFLWNAISTHWLIFTPFISGSPIESIEHLVAGVVGLLIMPAIMSIPFQVYSRMRYTLPPLVAASSFIFFWLAYEYLQLGWDMGWPWLTLGNSLAQFPWLVQYIDTTGIQGVSAHILIANLLIYGLLHTRNLWHRWDKVRMGSLLLLMFIPAVPFLKAKPKKQPIPHLTVRIVQPAFLPYQQNALLTRKQQINQLLSLTAAEPMNQLDAIIWPEGAITKNLTQEELRSDPLLAPVWKMIDTLGTPVITGMDIRKEYTSKDQITDSAEPDPIQPGTWFDLFPSAVALRPDTVISMHHKSHFMPFVDRVPFLPRLRFLESWGIQPASLYSSYARPDTVQQLEIEPGLTLAAAIREESIITEAIAKKVNKGASAILLLTNDSQWGKSIGYQQHYLFSRLRAIETHRTIIRSATTGISAFIDAEGEIVKKLNWMEAGSIDHTIPLYNDSTFYTRHGNYIGRISFYLSFLWMIMGVITAIIIKKRTFAPRET